MKNYQLVSEDQHSYVLHDGEKPFHIAKRPLDAKMHQKIKALPKFAEGGPVGGGDGEDEEPQEGIIDRIVNGTNALANNASASASPAISNANAIANTEGAAAGPISDGGPAPASIPNAPTPNPEPNQNPAPAPGNNAFGLPSMMGTYGQVLAGEKQAMAGVQESAEATKKQAEEQSQLYNKAVEDQKKIYDDSMARRKALDDEAAQITQAYASQKLDPNRLWHDTSTGGKIGAVLSMLVSGIGSGMTGAPNMAMGMMQKQIDRDIQAQMNDQSKQMNLYKFNRDRYQNEVLAEQATRMQMNAALQGQLAAVTAKYAGPQAQANADQLMGQLKSKYAMDQQQFLQTSAKYQAMSSLMGGGSGPNSGGGMTPERKILGLQMMGVVPKEFGEQAMKDLKDAQNLKSLHDEGMKIFDRVADLNTVAGKLNPQTQSKIKAMVGPYLDKLTKDTSGRVTPQTTELVGHAFADAIDNPKTIEDKRQNFHNFLLEKAAFPSLDALNANPLAATKFYARPAKGVSAKGK